MLVLQLVGQIIIFFDINKSGSTRKLIDLYRYYEKCNYSQTIDI